VGRWDDVGGLLASEARTLVSASAEFVLLCTNTMHKVADQIGEALNVPLVHIADATADAVGAAGMTSIGLLATAYTMEQDFYVGQLRDRHALDCSCPTKRTPHSP
jgi:aspartate racemase